LTFAATFIAHNPSDKGGDKGCDKDFLLIASCGMPPDSRLNAAAFPGMLRT